MLTAAVIGSCRVHTPVRLLERAGIATDHMGAEWYTHSTRDALQKLKVVRGQLSIPPDLVPQVVESHATKWKPEFHRVDFYRAADVFVVEVCSRKIMSRDGLFFQQWPVKEVTGNPERFPELAAYLSGATYRIQSREEVLGDLATLCERLAKPVIFVPHINVKMSNGQPFPERTIIRSVLEEYCALDPRATLFDPTPVVEAYGEEQALQDSGHYREQFQPVLAERMLAALENATNTHRARPVRAAAPDDGHRGGAGKRALVIGNCQAKSLAETLNLFVSDMAFDHLEVHSLQTESPEAYLARQAEIARDRYDVILSFELGDKFFCLSRDRIRDTLSGREVIFISNLWFDGYFPDIVTLGTTKARVDGPLEQYHSKIALHGYMSDWSLEETVASFRGETYEALGYFDNWPQAISRLAASDLGADLRFCDELSQLVAEDLCMFVVNHPMPVVFHRWAQRIAEGLEAMGIARKRPWLPHVGLLPAHFSGTSAFPFYPELAARTGLSRYGSYCFRSPVSKADSILDLRQFVEREFSAFEAAGRSKLADDPRWRSVADRFQAGLPRDAA